MRQHSVMKHNFGRVPQTLVPRSSFDMSFGHKTTMNLGILYPLYVQEVLPGDTHRVNATMFARFATMLFPIMDNVFIDTHFWFVPNRLVFDNWEKLCGYQRNPGDSTDYILPTVTSANTTDFNELTIYDYMAIATKKAGVEIQVLPLRGYNLIWNTNYRDENLQNSVVENVDDGPDAVTDYALLRRGKRYDYFTSALPYRQKGPAVELPLGSTAPVLGDGTAALFTQIGGGLSNVNLIINTGTNPPVLANGAHTGTTLLKHSETAPGLYADLSAAIGANVNDFRNAVTVQHMYERDARYGTRYVEVLKGHYGTDLEDYKAHRPIYLGGGSAPLSIVSVPQNSGTGQTGQTTPQGNLSGYGTLKSLNNGFIKSFNEHGYIIGLVSGRADLSYQQGTDRFWYRSTRFDHLWPEFNNIGEQAVLMREIYTLGTSADEDVWGYVPAWDDYRTNRSKITGLFRTNATGTLDSWHLAQDLSSPALNSTFIQDNPPTSRIKATNTDPDLLMDIYFHQISARPLTTDSKPGLLRI